MEYIRTIRTMPTFGSLFDGIGGFTLGLEQEGFTCAFQVDLYRPDESEPAITDHNRQLDKARTEIARKAENKEWAEINSYGRSLEKLSQRHYPNVLRLNDIRNVNRYNAPHVDILCGGFPCTDLSIAGKRAGLAGKHSGLFFEMVRLTDELQPAFLIWENVLGLLSSHRGQDFLVVLKEMERIGYSGAWSGFDARWFGLAQRRRRVFGVFARGDIGAEPCAEILSLQARLHWHLTQGGKKRENASPVIGTLAANGGGTSRPAGNGNELDFCNTEVLDQTQLASPIKASSPSRRNGGSYPTEGEFVVARCQTARNERIDAGSENFVVARSNTTREGQRWKPDQDTYIPTVFPSLDSNEGTKWGSNQWVDGGHAILTVFMQNTRDEIRMVNDGKGDIAMALQAQAGMKQQNYIAFSAKDNGRDASMLAPTLPAVRGHTSITQRLGVRRLTPLECERLQGFEDGWTDGFSDSTRYKMLGNAVAVPVVKWLAGRLRKYYDTIFG